MSEEAKKQAKKAAQKKQAKPKNEVLYSCVVLENVKIGSLFCSYGAKLNLPKDKAEALKELGKVEIEGIS
jgi:hypothetical protein|tara:strand:- start:550 stop:759 length:210 start_codon:yes stop_codon:yes gene_type:complete